jgi:hypothetical protein
MNEYDQSRKPANKSAAAAIGTLEKGKAALEQSAGITLENIRVLNVKMIDMARANTEAAFDLALKIATSKTPADVMELWSEHARRQFELLNEQTKELSALGQKMAGETVEPIARSVNQVFQKAS